VSDFFTKTRKAIRYYLGKWLFPLYFLELACTMHLKRQAGICQSV
jgi:hypothetical protein